MTIDGVEYVEAPERDVDLMACLGCAFKDAPGCIGAAVKADTVFGGTCSTRHVIYIKKEAAHG